MRKIKFRAWDKDEKRFWHFTLNDVLKRRMHYRGSWDEKVLRGEKTQFTGLKDKNDVEVYEGDILKRGDFPDEQPQYIVRFGKFTDSHDMYYEQEYIGWYVDEIGEQDKCRNPLTYIVDMLDGVVCGNIYENPELLK